MLTMALIGVAAIFALLFILRIGGAQRRYVARHAGAIGLGIFAVYALARAQFYFAAALTLAAIGVWFWGEGRSRADARMKAAAGPMDEAQARALLGVGPNATPAEIRAAYREKMKTAHPDQGGSTQAAARLNAARALLLQRY